MKTEVVIVGGGPSGLAASACLNLHSIPNIVLEREDCSAPQWRKMAYDRLKLHLPKAFCQLPHMPHPADAPDYIPRDRFNQYLDDYSATFKVSPRCSRKVESATYEEAGGGSWRVEARNTDSGEIEVYEGRFLVVATGENGDAFEPEVAGLDSEFKGTILHSSQYKSGQGFCGKDALVVGSGNSGMEIALDLCNHGAKSSIVVRSPVHVLSREMAHIGLLLLKFLPYSIVDTLLTFFSKIKFGNLAKYGIPTPKEGAFYRKDKYGKYPILDVGTVDKIKTGEIRVLPALVSAKGSNELLFANGELHCFDAIIFATGYKRSTSSWLKDNSNILDKDGLPKPGYATHWKGERGLYCMGLTRKGLYGLSVDAQAIADDIRNVLHLGI